ncbi:hypothetical protein CYY_008747 [Polysphondylium violaceum]|uniref:FNIP repeat-containing protein n=1 Tax=Polysphondylium violaceum TaxID=133409 RepID=A0A8J4PMP2_9MYCE|nr:hypothetical protein CYY_008747 [Polysphondylium violaceum]
MNNGWPRRPESINKDTNNHTLFSQWYTNNIDTEIIKLDIPFKIRHSLDKLKSDLILIISNPLPNISYLDLILDDSHTNFLKELFEKDIIPNTITHLSVFGITLSQDIQKPSSITHLTIEQVNDYNNIPSTVQQTSLYRVTDENIESPIPLSTKNVLWLSNLPIQPKKIPIGVKRLYLKFDFNHQISKNCIPDTVDYIKLNAFSGPLSDIKFPSNLKTLILKSQFIQYIPDELPKTITHLDITLDPADLFHWLYENGSLPHTITHLKIRVTGQLQLKLIVPSSLLFLDIDSQFHKYITIMDQKDYYQHPETSCMISPTTIQLYQAKPLLLNLTNLSIKYGKKKDYDPKFNFSICPPTLTILKCPDQRFIPYGNMFTYIEYSIEPCIHKIVFKNSDKPISAANLPIQFNVKTTVFTPNIIDKVEELHIEAIEEVLYQYYEPEVPSKPNLNIDVKKLYLSFSAVLPGYVPSSVTNLDLDAFPKIYPGSIPDGVKVLTSRYGLEFDKPDLIPPSVQIFNCCQLNYQFIPPTVKEININLSNENLKYLIQTKKENTSFIKKIKSDIVNVSNGSFFKIWRNNYLKKLIFESKYPSYFIPTNADQVLKAQNRFRNITLGFTDINRFTMEMFPNHCLNIIGVEINFPYSTDLLLSILPRAITRLKINYVKNMKLPSWITHLELVQQQDFWLSHNQLKSTDIPSSVTHLCLWKFKKILQNMIPSTIKYLETDCTKFGKNSIPSGEISVKFKNICTNSYEFELGSKTVISKPTNQLVPHIFVWDKNQPLTQGIVPNNTRKLIFGDKFNQPIFENSIPTSVTEIIFGEDFDQPISSIYLAPSLTCISFGRGSTYLSFETLPSSVRYLYFYYHIGQRMDTIPQTIDHVCLYNTPSDFSPPPHIKHIQVKMILNNCITKETTTLSLSPSVSSIQIDGSFVLKDKIESIEQEISQFGQHVQINLLPGCFNSFLKPGSLISNIKSIEFDSSYNIPILPGSLPDSVTRVCFGSSFNQPFSPPPFLKILDLGLSFNQPIKLPNSLEQLCISKKFNQPFYIGFFPHNLKIIRFFCHIDKPFERFVFPDSIQEIHIYSSKNDIFPTIDSLATNLKILTCHYFYGLFDSLPCSIQELIITEPYLKANQISARDIPDSLSLTKLTIAENQPIVDLQYLPNSIKHLKLGKHHFKEKIPDTIETLEFSNENKFGFNYHFSKKQNK